MQSSGCEKREEGEEALSFEGSESTSEAGLMGHWMSDVWPSGCFEPLYSL